MTDKHTVEELATLRDLIQDIDVQILELLSVRMGYVSSVGKIKKAHNIAIRNDAVFDKKLDGLMDDGEKKGLTRKFVRQIWRRIHHFSLNIQDRTRLSEPQEEAQE